MPLAELEAALSAAGFAPRGAFHPRKADQVPNLGPDRPARTVLLAGGAGPGMWRAFRPKSEGKTRGVEKASIDVWSRDRLQALAAVAATTAVMLR